MIRYACKFCICLYGIQRGEVPGFSHNKAAVEAHVKDVHEYPARSAREVLASRDPDQARIAAQIIEETGAVGKLHYSPEERLRDRGEMMNEPRDEFLEWVRSTHEVFSRQQESTTGGTITLSEICVRRLFADAQRARTVLMRTEFEKFGSDPCTRVLRLLQGTQISVGKACEWLRHYIHDGVQDPLPEETPHG